jgi:hypothetical protein
LGPGHAIRVEASKEKLSLLFSILTPPKRELQTAEAEKVSSSKKRVPLHFNIPVPQNCVSIGHWVILCFTMGKR